MIKGILFDFDGTLVDTSLDLANAVNMTREHYNLAPLDVDLVVSYVGDGMRKLVQRSLTEKHIDLDEAEALARKFYAQHPTFGTKFYTGAKEMLETLKQAGLKLALTSNKPTNLCLMITKTLKIDTLFDTIYGGSEAYPLKPSPAMLELAMRDLGLSASECLMIGDNWTDIDAGIAIGCTTAYFDQGFGQLKAGKADITFSTYSDLKEQFTQLKILSEDN